MSDHYYEFSPPIEVRPLLVLSNVRNDVDTVGEVKDPRWLGRRDLDDQLHGPLDE